MTQTITADLIKDWLFKTAKRLELARAEIDALNVFPVPDGDTGTNVFLTMDSCLQSVLDHQAEEAEEANGNDVDGDQALVELLHAAAQGALLGARGNSGVILSQYIRGFAKAAVDDEGEVDTVASVTPGKALANGLEAASKAAYSAVGEPKEGTILSVAAAVAARATEVAAATDDLETVVVAAQEESKMALARTPDQLPVLKEAGVVDSGGRALVEMMTALRVAVTGEEIPVDITDVKALKLETHDVGDDYEGPEYEVMYLIEIDDEKVPELRESLLALGDSLVVVGGDRTYNVHVHVDDAGKAVETGIALGKPYRIKITHLLAHQDRADQATNSAPKDSEHQYGRGLVAVSHGPGIKTTLEEQGVSVVEAVPGRRSSTQELLDGIKNAHSKQVILLPSDKDTTGVAEAASSHARQEGVRVAVIPTRSIVQTLAALAVHDPSANFDDDVASMGRAAGATRYGAVTIASRDSQTDAGSVKSGDALGLVDGDIVVIEQTLEQAADKVIEHMVRTSSEILTIVSGADARPELVERISAKAEELNGMIEIEEFDGGQPLWPLILGVE